MPEVLREVQKNKLFSFPKNENGFDADILCQKFGHKIAIVFENLKTKL